ncbi:MAG TPA: hypothetical protein DIT13_11900 [Verrucomicrobiales bacterium]|nr:hypothetical protein [Verrucomicrobiales bacterium]
MELGGVELPVRGQLQGADVVHIHRRGGDGVVGLRFAHLAGRALITAQSAWDAEAHLQHATGDGHADDGGRPRRQGAHRVPLLAGDAGAAPVESLERVMNFEVKKRRTLEQGASMSCGCPKNQRGRRAGEESVIPAMSVTRNGLFAGRICA